MQVCANCKHFLANPEEGQQLGWCRRYPPTRRVFKRAQTDERGAPVHDVLGREVWNDVEESSYPSVQADFWCGEWLSPDRMVHPDLQRLIRPTAEYSFKPATQEIAEGIDKAKDHVAEAAGRSTGKGT